MRTRAWIMMLSVLAILPWNAWAGPGARAWLDRNSMQLGETVTLNIESDDSTASEPDFSGLLNDFNSLGTQSSRQISMTNGSTSAKTVWAIGLEPKRAGTLTIPSFNVGGASTDPLVLTVLPAPTGAQGKPGDSVFVEVTAEPLAPYVQQQVRYTAKLYYLVDLSDGSLDEPSASGLVAKKLGRDKQYVATRDGRRYHVLERSYALTPEQSGPLTIPALGFRGSAVDNSDPTGFFRRGRAVNARSDAIQLDVRPKPANWGSAPWLPATSLSLADESELPAEIKVGEPLTRTIRLRAQGLGFEQLPELELEKPEGTEIYPDKPDTRTRDDGAWLYGERTRKFAIVPTRPGRLVLPPIEVHWWNIAQDRAETAVLPEREIRVLPGATAMSAPPAATGEAAPTTAETPAQSAPIIYPGAEATANVRLWRWLALALAVLWLGTLGLWWKSRRSPPDVAPAAAPPPTSGRSAFLRACAMGDLVGAERALVAWARGERAGVRNLGELITALDSAGQCEALAELLRMRYAGATTEGLGARLTRAFRDGIAWRDAKTVAGEAPALPPLYPGGR